jgi:transposase-like protein
MGKTTNKFSPEVGERAVRMGLAHEGDHPSRRAAIVSIAEKIGCTAQTLNERVKKTEVAYCAALTPSAMARESLLIPGSAEPSGLHHLVPKLSD